MSKKIIAGNWKQNGTLKSSISLTKKVLQAVKKEKYTHEIIIIPPSIFLLPVKDLIHKSQIKLGAQNVSAFDDGAYTGEISGSMLNSSSSMSFTLVSLDKFSIKFATSASCKSLSVWLINLISED